MTKRIAENLFRGQAIEALSKRPYGRPIAIMPRPWLWVISFIGAIAIAAAIFFVSAEYSRKEQVRGWLVSRDGVVRVTHDAASRVEHVVRAPGDVVRAGDPIIVLSRETFLADGRSTSQEAISALNKQLRTIETQVQLLDADMQLEQRSITTQLEELEKERTALQRQYADQAERIGAAKRKLSLLTSVADSGAVTDWDRMKQQDELGALRQSGSQLQQRRSALERDRELLRLRARRLPVETEQALSGLRLQQSRLQQRITEQESDRRVVLKSPIAGKVAAVEVHAGTTVMPRQLLATVLPKDLSLVAEVYVPSSAIGFIRQGQNVRLQYDAFPQQQFGSFRGTVDSISDFVLLPAEVPQTFSLREATFKVRIAIAANDIGLENGRAVLRPGMLLAAEIILENRSLADWLLEPLRWRRRGSA